MGEAAKPAVGAKVAAKKKKVRKGVTRGIAHMEWALQDRPGVHDLIEYESRLNDVLAECGDVVICAYDLTKFTGDLILDVLRSHRMIIIDGSLRENPFYAPPGG